MLESFALPPVNRLLRENAWALEALRAHAGKTVRFASPPFDLRVTIGGGGELHAAAVGASPELTIIATPGALLRLLARDDGAWKAAQVSGDMDFAATVDHVRRNLEWDYEEDLSRVLGDVAAHRVGGALRDLERWGRSTLANLGQSAAEYAVYERPAIASREGLEAFCRDVDEARDHAARLEKRIELLRRRIEP